VARYIPKVTRGFKEANAVPPRREGGLRYEQVDINPEWAWNEAEAIPPGCAKTETMGSFRFRKSCMLIIPFALISQLMPLVLGELTQRRKYDSIGPVPCRLFGCFSKSQSLLVEAHIRSIAAMKLIGSGVDRII
jgi:hypothetical protein